MEKQWKQKQQTKLILNQTNKQQQNNSELTGVAVDRMEVTEVFTAKFFRHYKKDDQDLEAIQERDEIYAYVFKQKIWFRIFNLIPFFFF